MPVNYEPVIGLEVHVELLTRTKLFCGCPNRFGAPPNTLVCPTCLGLPGTLPVLNRRAVELLVQAGISVDCAIPPRSKMDRKNYYYPDMPKNFQISQYDLPLAVGGHLDIETETDMAEAAPEAAIPHQEGAASDNRRSVQSRRKRIRITRIHLEEDTGKSTHANTGDAGRTGGRIDSAEYTLEDYNRAGVPLAEIVSEPDIANADEAVAYLVGLREIMRWIGVSDCKMEEGSLRCDANVSVRPVGATELGTKAEIKNLNSFKSVHKAITYEIRRQIEACERGERIVQETRAWDEAREITHSLRSKEFAHDYRYFPEPDLPPLEIDADWLDRLRVELPELPEKRRARFVAAYGLSEQDAVGLTRTRSLADFFERTVPLGAPAKEAANWLLGDVSRLLNSDGIGIEASRLTPESLAAMLGLIGQGTISKRIAREVLDAMYATGQDPRAVVQERGLQQLDSAETLRPVVQSVLDRNAKSVVDYLGGREKVFEALIGQVMGATRGKANPARARDLLRSMLEETRSEGGAPPPDHPEGRRGRQEVEPDVH